LSANLSAAFGASFVGIVVLTFNVVALTLYGATKVRPAKELAVPVSLP
jgi:hypothetical protein